MSNLFSYSKLSSFQNCPYGYYLTYIQHIKGEDNVYGILGNVVHDMYELLTKDEITIEEAKEKFKQEYELCKFLGLTFPTKMSEEKYVYDVEHSFDYFIKPTGRLEQERYFQIEIENKTFRGYIDLIIFDDKNKTIRVIDYKTSSRFSKTDCVE